MSSLVFTGLAAFLLLSLLKRDWAVYLIIILLPAYQIRFQIQGLPFTFLEGMILILAAVQFISIILSLRAATPTGPGAPISRLRNEVRNNKLQLTLIGLFLLAALISIFVSPVERAAAGIFKAYFAEAVLFYFLVRLIINTREKLENVFKSLMFLVLYLSAYGLYQFVTLHNLPFSWWAVDVASRRIVSALNHPNALALLLGPVLAMLIVKRPKNRLHWAAIILGLPAFYLTFSRAGWLALVVTLVMHHIFSGSSLKIKDLRKGLLTILGIITIVLAIPFSRHKLLELAGPDPSKQNRYVLWSAAADMIKKHPLAGVGLMGFHENFKNYPVGPDKVVQNYPHNIVLTFWTETGLLGVLSMLGLLVLFYKKIRLLSRMEKYRNFALAAGAGMAMIVLHSLVDVPYFKNDLSVLFWLVYALPNLTFLSSQT